MLKIDTSSQKINDFLERGVKEVTTPESVMRKLSSGRVLRIKHGVDPSGQDLHLGHASVYLKLRDLQDMGHKIVFLIGGFTGRFGDPTEKLESRALKSKEEAEANAHDYVNQISKILNVKEMELRTNSEWYDKMSAEEFIKLLAHFTVDQVLARDMFQERKNKKLPIRLHETVYPVLQGYDSVMLKSDLTVIGTDQIFNENFGRELQKKYNQEPQDIVAIGILVGLDGAKKMGKSLNNYISINAGAREQFGQIMSLPDSVIIDYFTLATRVDLKEVKEMAAALQNKSVNPRDFKLKLAQEIVGFYHSPQEALKETENFVKTFSKRTLPEEITELVVNKKELKLLDLIMESKLASSKSEARRLIEDGAVDIDGATINSPDKIINIGGGVVIKIGKHRFAKIKND